MSGKVLLSVRGLTKRFGGLVAVDGLDFDLRPGEILGLIGPNGAGFGGIVFGSTKSRATEAQTALQARELIEFVGLKDLLDTPVTALSFGQGRLLEVARALCGGPKLMLFDEPAAGLTPAEATRLSNVIRQIAAGDIPIAGYETGIAVLLIEHDMRFLLPLAQRVVVLNFGKKIADATPDRIRDDPAVVQAYLGDTAGLAAGAAATEAGRA